MDINRREFVKSGVLSGLALMCAGSSHGGGTISGRVSLQRKGVKGMLVSDGVNFAVTDADGRYSLEVSGRQPCVYVHQTREYQAKAWYHNLEAGRTVYDFALRPTPPCTGRFLQVADSETTSFSCWLPELKSQVRDLRPDFVVHTGDICRMPGIRAHAREFTEQAFGVPAYVIIGNHDIVEPENGQNYNTFFGPNYYSFEWGPYLMVAAPMNYGDIKLPYDLLDFGDYLEKLFKLVGDRPLIVLSHELLDNREHKFIKGHKDLQVDLRKHHLHSWFFGHWHDNMVIRYVDGTRGYCAAPPNKGGIQHSPACVRLVEQVSGGKLASRLIWAGFHDHVSITVPAPAMIPASDTFLPISVVSYDSASLVKRVQAVITGEGGTRKADLRTTNGLSWNGRIRIPNYLKGARFDLAVTATKSDGQTVTRRRAFAWVPGQAITETVKGAWHNYLRDAKHCGYCRDVAAERVSLQWLAQMPGDNYMVSPTFAEGKVFAAVMDDHNGAMGGVYAYHAASGEPAWQFVCGNSIKNSLAYGEGRIFFQDSRGITYSLRATDGKLMWKQGSPHTGLSAITSGAAYSDGVLYAGHERSLAAFDASSGEILWREKSHWGSSTNSTLTVYDGVLMTSIVWRMLYAVDARNGKTLWEIKDDDTRFQSATVSIYDGKAYAKSATQVLELDPHTGKILRKASVGWHMESGSAPAVAQELIVTGTGSRGLIALDRRTLKQRWACEDIRPALLDTCPYQWRARTVESSPVILGDTVWVGANDGCLYGVELATGNVRQKLDLGTPLLTSVAAAEGWLYVTDFGGRLYGLRTRKG